MKTQTLMPDGVPALRDTPTGLGAAAFRGLENRFRSASGATQNKARKAAERLMRRFFKQFHAGDHSRAALTAVDAIGADKDYALAYHGVALALEKLGQLPKAIEFFEKAVALDPSDADIYYNLGNTAWRMEMLEVAAKLFRMYLDRQPDNPLGWSNLASVLRDMGRFDEALETARAALLQLPDNPHLWNTLATILLERGDLEECFQFLDEALRLRPDFGLALHNKAFAQFNQGRFEDALTTWSQAFSHFKKDAQRKAEVGHGMAQCELAMGRLATGWDSWKWRHDPGFRTNTHFAVPLPRWEGEDLAGKRILAVAEQGIGDEIMLANTLPDLAQAVGPEGAVLVAVSRRLLPLFERSFPGMTVGPLKTVMQAGRTVRLVPWLTETLDVDFFAPFGDTMCHLRRDIRDFPTDRVLFKPDPEAVSQWRSRLAAFGPGPKIGVCWRSGKVNAARAKFYCPLPYWAPLFGQQDVTWINLQYDDCIEDRATIERDFGAHVHDFEDLDLRNDLDGNAALCAALDLVISAPTAAAALAGGIGTKTWIVSNAILWPTLGTGGYPWYPDTSFFAPDRFADWQPVMARMSHALADHVSDQAAA